MEVQILIDNYSTKSIEDLAKMLPHRTKQSIMLKASKLGLKKYKDNSEDNN